MYEQSLTDRARGRWVQIITALAPHPDMLAAIRRGPSRHGWCPVHRGKHGDAFRIDEEFPETGLVHCNTCKGRSGFGVLMWLNGWDVETTARELARYLNDQDPRRARPATPVAPAAATPERREDDDTGPTIEQLEQMWSNALDADHPDAGPLRKYLARRGLATLEVPTSIRCLPDLKYFQKDAGTGRARLIGVFPAMLARIDTLGTLVGLHRTYLTPDGDKAPVSPAKKLLRARHHTAAGSAVQLSPVGATLGIAEGLETSLSVLLATGLPMWAATSAALLGSVRIPRHVRRVVIWADLDERVSTPQGVREPGREAAEKLERRLLAEGRLVDIYYPSSQVRGVDWNDVWRQHGQTGFPNPNLRAVSFPTVRQLLTRIFG